MFPSIPPWQGDSAMSQYPLDRPKAFGRRAGALRKPMTGDETIAGLLAEWRDGSVEARDELFTLVHTELHTLARGLMRGQSPAHTLGPTALVNEACLRLCGSSSSLEDRNHFLRLAARSMRQILVDHARRKQADKRVARELRVDLEDVLAQLEQRSSDLVDLDAAMSRLGEMSPELVELVELRFFAGLPLEEAARVMGLSPRSAARRWQAAKAVLYDELRR